MNPALSISHPEPTHPNLSNGGRLVTTDGRALPLQSAALHADLRGGVARVVLEQRFENPYAEPLAVTYSLPLPADAAVSGFAFRIGERRVVGEIDGRKAARERYEQALVEGRSAALLEQDRSSLFTQEIGNVPPQRRWWWRSSSTSACAGSTRAPGSGASPPWSPRATWASRAAWRTPPASCRTWPRRPLPARMSLACAIRDALARGRRPESPSHPLTRRRARAGALRVSFADEGGVRLDRDLVVRWAVATPKVGVSLDCRPSARRRASAGSVVRPPHGGPAGRARARPAPVPRDLIVLLDTSGSMGGEPLSRRRRVVSALIETAARRRPARAHRVLEQRAPLEVRARSPRPATARGDALAWLARSTPPAAPRCATASSRRSRRCARSSQRQVVLMTDGLIGFESEVVAAICERLPASSRLHTVGVGSAVNRSLTGPAARAGRGVEVVIGLGEDPERAAARLVARTRAPILVELAALGPALDRPRARAGCPDLFAGAPACGRLAPRRGRRAPSSAAAPPRAAGSSASTSARSRPASGSQAAGDALRPRGGGGPASCRLAAGGDVAARSTDDRAASGSTSRSRRG